MPVLWRYLLRSFFQVLILSVCAFIGVLLVLRFQEIARFAASGAPSIKVALFILYQIPYILPLAIPVSCLIAGIILFQKLSHLHELTAFRACGLGLRRIVTPLICAGVFLSATNFMINCEMAPRCRGLTKELIFQMAAVNPLFLLQKESLVKLKNIFVDMKVLKAGKNAEDVILVVKNTSTDRLAVIAAQKLTIWEDLLKGDNVVIISSVDSKIPDSFDHLVIENQAEMNTQAANLSQFIKHADWQSSYEYMPLRMILASEAVEKGDMMRVGRYAKLEIVRRLSLSFAALTFTLIGIACGMEISRNRSKKKLFWAIGLAAFYLVCFVMAKSIRHSPMLSICIYLIPHPIIILLSLRSIRSVNEGVE